MDKSQEALINHIKAANIFKTVKPYAGEIKDAAKLPSILPAALVMFMAGSVNRGQVRTSFDVLVINESKVFDKAKGNISNTKFTSDLMHYCDDNLLFTYDNEEYSFNEDIYQAQETNRPVTCDAVVQTERFTINAVHLSVLK